MVIIKIVLISADDSLTNSISSCLKQSGYQVVSTSHGIGTIELIHHEKPSLVILDGVLPDYSSLAIIRLIRVEESISRIPLILMGANMREEDALIGLEVGADLCLLETFHPQVFVSRVRSLLRRTEPLKIRL
ncbi:MAG: response regulator [Anaerolineales bacterium]